MITYSTVQPDIDLYEKSAAFETRPASNSIGSRDSGKSNVLGFEQGSAQAAAPGGTGVTPLPAWIDISLAVMTLGLSVPALHAVRGVSEKRAAKKALKQQQIASASVSDSNAYLVPSSVVRSATTTAPNTGGHKAMELDSTSLKPPPYSPGNQSQIFSQDCSSRAVAELP